MKYHYCVPTCEWLYSVVTFFLRAYPVRTFQTIAAIQNRAKGHLHCFCQPIWMSWQYAKHLQPSSHPPTPLSLVLCLYIPKLRGLISTVAGLLWCPFPAMASCRRVETWSAFKGSLRFSHCSLSFDSTRKKSKLSAFAVTQFQPLWSEW